MDDRYERHCLADPLFYDVPPATERPYPAATAALPPGWERVVHGPWVNLAPPGTDLPEQGWKVHVSAAAPEAERVIATVLEHCTATGTPVKFLRSPARLLAANAKYAPREASGKLLTLYPLGEQALHHALTELSAALKGTPGPYVLSDLRWQEGPLYLRYGAYRRQWTTGADGRRVPALRGPDGALVPDVRGVVFTVPDWAPVPEFVAGQIAEAAAAPEPDFPFDVAEALHFSNGGGVYRATDRRDGRTVVLREARPHAGLDADGRDAVERLHRERAVLERLAGLDFVPALYEYRQDWEHHFLVEEHIEGEPLERAFTRRCPLTRPDPSSAELAEYTAWALDVVGQLELMLGRLHERGLVFGDLHPGNVLLRPDGRCALVDFELAFPVDAAEGPALGAPGFVSPAARRGTAVDRYALAALRLYLLLPLNPLLHLDSGKAEQALAEIPARYPVPEGFAAATRAALREAVGGELPGGSAELAGGPPPAPWPAPGVTGPAGWWPVLDSLAEGIRATATPGRTDRLFPGDVAQFEPGGPALSLAHGAAGVLYALHGCGYRVPEEQLDWLVERARALTDPRPGLYDGLAGVAWALRRMGRPEQAEELLDRAEAAGPPGAPGLGSGRAGLALALLDSARHTGDRDRAARAYALADGLTALVPDGAPGAPHAPGLLDGRAGLAALFHHLHADSGEPRWATAAEAALRSELAGATRPEGMLMLTEPDGRRLLPYLAAGGVGLGLLIAAVPAWRTRPDLAAALASADRACRPRLVAAAGLFEGRAGMLLHLARGGQWELMARHLWELRLQVAGLRGHWAVPGRRLHRFSTDLATGAAGVMLALHEAVLGPVPLPGLTDLPGGPAGAVTDEGTPQ
ncbi:class III lanthionine synthetase LanKC [Kitasatospora sp. NPDC004289]